MHLNRTTKESKASYHNLIGINSQNGQNNPSGLSSLLQLDTQCSDDVFWQKFKQLMNSYPIIDALCCDKPELDLTILTEADKAIIAELKTDTIPNNNYFSYDNLSVCARINKLLQTAYSQCYKINPQRRKNSYHPYFEINVNKSQTDRLKSFNRHIGYNPQYLPCKKMSDNELWTAFTSINHEYAILNLENWNVWRPLNSNASITFVNLYNKAVSYGSCHHTPRKFYTGNLLIISSY